MAEKPKFDAVQYSSYEDVEFVPRDDLAKSVRTVLEPPRNTPRSYCRRFCEMALNEFGLEDPDGVMRARICTLEECGHCNALLIDSAAESVLSGMMFRIVRQTGPEKLLILQVVISALQYNEHISALQ